LFAILAVDLLKLRTSMKCFAASVIVTEPSRNYYFIHLQYDTLNLLIKHV